MKSDKKLFAMQMDKLLEQQLKKEAQSMGLSLSAYIRFILMKRHK